MLSVRKIAQELLPLVVLVWATLAILGDSHGRAVHDSIADEGSAAIAGLGLCAVTVAIIWETGTRRVPSLPSFAARAAWKPRFSLRATRPAVSEPERPPSVVLSLEFLQVMRT